MELCLLDGELTATPFKVEVVRASLLLANCAVAEMETLVAGDVQVTASVLGVRESERELEREVRAARALNASMRLRSGSIAPGNKLQTRCKGSTPGIASLCKASLVSRGTSCSSCLSEPTESATKPLSSSVASLASSTSPERISGASNGAHTLLRFTSVAEGLFEVDSDVDPDRVAALCMWK